MKTIDFEKAVEAVECELLRIAYQSGSQGQVEAAYGAVSGTLTYVKWDDTGRAFVYVQSEDSEDCVSESNLASLPYERDPKFDLQF